MRTTTRLAVVLVLNLVLVVGLVVVGLTARSLGVLAAGADYVADAAAIVVSLLAIWLSRRPAGPGRRNRFRTATAWAAGVNGAWLLVLSVLIVIGAVERLVRHVPHVHGLPVLMISCIAALTMFAGAVILRGDGYGPALDDDVAEAGQNLAMRAVLLDTVADAAIALGVALTGGIIVVTGGLFWLDPAVAIGVSVVVAYHAVRLLRDVAAHIGARASIR
jgi:cation diffusion facilitator family transporter